MTKPFSQACENNQGPILEVLRRYLRPGCKVLEIGSGTGQHAVFFGAQLPEVIWQTSDRLSNHAGIRQWLDDAGLDNVRRPLALDVLEEPWPGVEADAVFSANTAHIMNWPAVEAMVTGVGRLLKEEGLFLLYGPFSYGGVHTSESNRAFDASLRMRDPSMGIRDFERVDALARASGLALRQDVAMPANNRLLAWQKSIDPDAAPA